MTQPATAAESGQVAIFIFFKPLRLILRVQVRERVPEFQQERRREPE